MTLQEIIKVEIVRDTEKVFDFPVTFICGYQHFLNTGVVTPPKKGVVVYMFSVKRI